MYVTVGEIRKMLEDYEDEKEIAIIVADGYDNWNAQSMGVNSFYSDDIELVISLHEEFIVTDGEEICKG